MNSPSACTLLHQIKIAGAVFLLISEFIITSQSPGQSLPQIPFKGISVATATAPTATTEPVSGMTDTSVVLNGVVNPNADSTTADFEWGPTAAYGFTTPVQELGNGTLDIAISAALGGLDTSVVYHFRVVATNTLGPAAGGDRTFQLITAPVLASPANGTINQSSTLTLSWNAASRAQFYQLQVATDSNFTHVVVFNGSVSGTSLLVGPLSPSTQYYWRVGSGTLDGLSAYSGAWSFTTKIGGPANLTALVASHRVSLKWDQVLNAPVLRYRIYRNTTPPADILLDSTSAPDTVFADTGLTNGTAYYYRVTAVDSQLSESDFSNQVSATPENAPPVVTRLSSVYIPNAGQVLTMQLVLVDTGSYDPDGTIDSVQWYVNGVLAGIRDTLVYNFGPGTSKVILVVIDNEHARSSDTATVTRTAFVGKLEGPLAGGLSMLGDSLIYGVAQGDPIYQLTAGGATLNRFFVSGNVVEPGSIASDTTLYVGCLDGRVVGFLHSGVTPWASDTLDGAIRGTVAIDSEANRLYAGTEDSGVYALDRGTGVKVWRYGADAPIRTSAVITFDRKLVISTIRGTIYGFDLANFPFPAAPTWIISAGDSIVSSPAIDALGFIFLVTRHGTVLKLSLDRESQVATILWQTNLDTAVTTSPTIDAGGILYIGGLDSKLYALDASSGAVLWSFTTGGPIRSTPAISDSGTVYVGNDAGEIYALTNDGSSAGVKWYYRQSASIISPLLYRNGTVYLSGSDSTLVGIYDSSGYGPPTAESSGSIGIPMWGTYQGNNQRTGAQAQTGTSRLGNIRVGWNMISLPVQISDPGLRTRSALFPTSTSRIFAYDPDSGYVHRDTMENNVGYWLKFDSIQTIVLSGADRLLDTVHVDSQWNLIGTLSRAVWTGAIISDPPGNISSLIFGYSGGYFVTDSLQPLHGYWVRARSAGEIILSASAAVPKGTLADGGLNKLAKLVFRDASGKASNLYFGDTGPGEKDFYQLPPTPPESGFDVRYATNLLAEFTDGKVSREIPVRITSAQFPVKVEWDLNNVNVTASLVIGQRTVGLATKGSVTVLSSNERIFLRLGVQTVIPADFRLEEAYPNPFNPSTTIRYDLPVESRVTLRIYNLLGENVATLANGIEEAGYRQIEWNAAGYPSGIYFYRFDASGVGERGRGYSSVKKLILVK